MPTYSYACTECDNRFDIVQSFTDDTLTVCPACSGKLRKLFNSVGIVFKGSGFYRTDSRGGSGTSSEGAGEKKSDAAAAKSDSKSESKSDSKPAEKKSSDSSSSSKSSSSSTTKAAASQ
ncbi:MAG: FmdB family zinc ribbon protein [Rhodococcus sp. (in: high G+C Gram-positive bacteria)]